MAGIKFLTEIYRKQGKEFLDNLFKRDVVITEMLNGSSFSFERNLNDGEISFYKRDQINPISKIDRTLMKYYELPIQYITRLPEETKEELPIGWKFGLEYFINNQPLTISYDKLPKNNLVLTHIVVKDDYGDVERTIVDKKELDYWADFIGVERPPIIFQGKLDDEQKSKIHEYLSTAYDVLSYQYGTSSFAKYLISVLNPALKKTTLNDDLDKPIEGVVFRFGTTDGYSDGFNAKLIDPVFAEITKDNKSSTESFFPNDIYGITVLEVMNFILDKGLSYFQYTGEDIEDKYISFICDVYEKFLDDYGEDYRGIDFDEPDFLKGQGFEVNVDKIPSEKSQKLVKEDKSFETLFKLVLSAFRKLKKKAGGFFTEGSIQQFNILVREISSYLDKPVQVIESTLPTFGEFRRETKSFIIEEEVEILDEMPEVERYQTLNEAEETEKVEIEEGDEPEEETEEPKIEANEDPRKKVNLYIGNFQPFNNGHLNVITRAKQEDQLPIVIAVVEPREGSSKFFVDLDTVKKMMTSIANDFPDLIEDVIYVKNDILETAIDKLTKTYNVVGMVAGKDRFDNYVLQKKSLIKKEKIEPEFHIYSTPYWGKSTEIRDYLDRKDYVNFKKNSPKSIIYLWEEFIKLHNLSKNEKNHQV